MEQKFVTFDEALEKLGVSADLLNELRERGQLRAYRDGASWKFRSDEIQKMMDEGVPEPAPPSDIGLIDDEDLVDSEPLDAGDDDLGLGDDLQLADDELELEVADDEGTKISKEAPGQPAPVDSELEPDLADTDTLSTGSELELADLDDTVTAGASDLAMDDAPADPSDSILLSEEELGESVGPRSSTVIGKDESEDADLDLELADDDDVLAADSDVKLASPGASDVLSSQIAGSGVLDTETGSGSEPGPSAFEDLEELEIDLAAESSRVLSPEEVEDFKASAAEANQPDEDSDLRLDDDGLDDDSNMGSTDVPMLELEGDAQTVDEGSGSEIELAGDSDLDLGDASGSDITLDSGDSGINLVSPSDSGLALDDIPLDIGGSAILSSLSLSGDSDPEISLVGDADGGDEGGAELQTDDDFQLTPMTEGGAEGDGDSSSQVIALDADFDDMGASAVSAASGFEAVEFTEEAEEAVVLSEDFSEAPADQFEPSYSAAPAAAVSDEMPYGVSGMLLLGSATTFLTLCSLMLFDVLRNIWTWNEEFSMSSDLMEGLLTTFGLK